MYPRVADMILDIETCKPGPEQVQWQRHSYVKLNYGLRVKALRGHRTDRQHVGSRVRNSKQSQESLLWTSTPGTPSLHNTEGELSKAQFYTELAE